VAVVSRARSRIPVICRRRWTRCHLRTTLIKVLLPSPPHHPLLPRPHQPTAVVDPVALAQAVTVAPAPDSNNAPVVNGCKWRVRPVRPATPTVTVSRVPRMGDACVGCYLPLHMNHKVAFFCITHIYFILRFFALGSAKLINSSSFNATPATINLALTMTSEMVSTRF